MPRRLDPEERKRRAAARYRKWAAENKAWKMEYQKAYALSPEGRSRRNTINKRWRSANRDRLNAERRAKRRRNAEQYREQSRAWHAASRLRAIERLGGCCMRCGFSDTRALEFDHREPLLKSRGRRRSSIDQILVMENPAAVFDLLCANCHTIKTKENGEHWSRKREEAPALH